MKKLVSISSVLVILSALFFVDSGMGAEVEKGKLFGFNASVNDAVMHMNVKTGTLSLYVLVLNKDRSAEIQIFEWDPNIADKLKWVYVKTILDGQLLFAHNLQFLLSDEWGDCLIISDTMNNRIIIYSLDEDSIVFNTKDFEWLSLSYPNEVQISPDRKRIMISNNWDSQFIELDISTGENTWLYNHNYKNIHDIDYLDSGEGITFIATDQKKIVTLDWSGNELDIYSVENLDWPRAFSYNELSSHDVYITDRKGIYRQIGDEIQFAYMKHKNYYNFQIFQNRVGIFPCDNGIVFLNLKNSMNEIGFLEIESETETIYPPRQFTLDDILELERMASMGYITIDRK